MAKSGDTPTETAAPAKKGKGVLVLVAVAVLMLLIGGGGAWFFLSHKKVDHPGQAKVEHKSPVFMTLEPFVVNLAGDVQHYLQVGIDLRVADNSVPDQVKLHLPEIRNGVLLLLSSKKVEDLTTVEQKNQLRSEIRQVVNQPLGINTPAAKAPTEESVAEAHAADAAAPHAAADADSQAGVLEVLLTSFVIQ